MSIKSIALLSVIIMSATCFGQEGDSTDTKNLVDDARIENGWAESNFLEGDDGLHSFGMDLNGWQYKVNDRLWFRLNGVTFMNDLPIFIQEGHTRFSFRGAVNTLLFAFYDIVWDIHKRTEALHWLWFSNSDYRYTLSDRWYLGWGAETHYFFVRQDKAHQGILFSPKAEFQFKAATNEKMENAFLAIYAKVNLFWDFQAPSKFYGVTVGLRYITTTFTSFME